MKMFFSLAMLFVSSCATAQLIPTEHNFLDYQSVMVADSAANIQNAVKPQVMPVIATNSPSCEASTPQGETFCGNCNYKLH